MSRPCSKIVTVLLFAFVLGCASSVGVVDFRSVSSSDQLPKQDQELWNISRHENDYLKKSGLIYSDSLLGDYLQEVGMKLVPEEFRNSFIPFRFQAILDPELNAFALPDGNVYVHIGLLARLKNESQLAQVLGHEVNHVLRRHAVQSYANLKSTVAITEIFSTALAIGFSSMQSDWSGFWNSLAQSTLYMTALASINGYGREAEKQADLEGLSYMQAAQYDARQAPGVFEILLEEYNDPSAIATFFYSDHPRLKERVNYINSRLKTLQPEFLPPQTAAGANEYQQRTALTRHKIVELWVRAGKYQKALKDAGPVLEENPSAFETRFWLGEAYRKISTNPDTLELARQEFMKVIQYAPDFAKAYRSLGALAEVQRDTTTAVQEYQKYLEFARSPKDKLYIINHIDQLLKKSKP